MENYLFYPFLTGALGTPLCILPFYNGDFCDLLTAPDMKEYQR